LREVGKGKRKEMGRNGIEEGRMKEWGLDGSD
jgi:hypothetical protein